MKPNKYKYIETKIYSYKKHVKYSFLKIVFLTIIVFFGTMSCRNFGEKIVEVDFIGQNKQSSETKKIDTAKYLIVVVAAMLSPKETFIYYEDLFNYISQKFKLKIEFKQRPTYNEVNSLLISNEADIAFICSGAYIDIARQVDLLVVPVCDGKPYYQAYIITHKESRIDSFSDFQGKSFAYTDKLSNTGKLYADKCVKDLNQNPAKFFKKSIYSSSHDVSIQMVAKKFVDGASVDGLIFNYMKKYQHKKVENIKIIEKSQYFGIPPIVTSRKMSSVLKEKLKSLFLNMHNDERGKKILDKLLIDKFIVVGDTLYNNIRKNNELLCR